MKKINIIFIVTIIFMLSGCRIGPNTYEIFVENLKPNIGNSFIPEFNAHRREIYDKNRHIYKFKGEDPRCVYGFLTNRDEKPEIVQELIILSGKEYCKDQIRWTLS
ncbi:hypothetical protein [Campylobacter sputorum]|uniref:hypothetical protein n=1 Tax=Campylobacter sputorum TaxID=206 RepID=UPI00053BE376|nr:hypothetical protein [Campylobacter sputorum]